MSLGGHPPAAKPPLSLTDASLRMHSEAALYPLSSSALLNLIRSLRPLGLAAYLDSLVIFVLPELRQIRTSILGVAEHCRPPRDRHSSCYLRLLRLLVVAPHQCAHRDAKFWDPPGKPPAAEGRPIRCAAVPHPSCFLVVDSGPREPVAQPSRPDCQPC